MHTACLSCCHATIANYSIIINNRKCNDNFFFCPAYNQWMHIAACQLRKFPILVHIIIPKFGRFVQDAVKEKPHDLVFCSHACINVL